MPDANVPQMMRTKVIRGMDSIRRGAVDVVLFAWLFMKIDLSRPLDFSITLALVIFFRVCGESVARRVT
jgi:hypothetical protein